MDKYEDPHLDTLNHVMDVSRYVESIPPLPIIVAHALQLKEDDDLSVVSLAHALEADPALTSRLLRAANSAFYGLTERIYTVRDAIIVIGFEAVRSLAITTTVVSGMWVDNSLFDRQRFWRHSLRTGLFAKRIATIIKFPKPDVVFTLGVLHDIGRAAMMQIDADRFSQALERMRTDGKQLWMAERSVFGANHAEIGGALAEKWNLPEEYVVAIQHHHTPSSAGPERILSQVIALADSLSHAAAPGDRQGYITPPLLHDLWEPLNLDEGTVRNLYNEHEYIERITRSLYETAAIG